MRSYFVVVACVGDQQPAQVSLAEDDGVVKALAANGPNQSFGKTVLPRRARRDRFVANAHCTHPLANNRAKDLVPVADSWKPKVDVLAIRLTEAFGNRGKSRPTE